MFILAGITAVLTACGGGGGNALPSAVPSGTASGTALDGLILNGTVTVYDFSSGTKGAVLGQATTDSATGAYSLSLQVESRPILLEITGGYYTEEAAAGGSTTTVTLDSTDKLDAVVNYTTGQPLTVAITAYTNLAAGLAQYEIKTGVPVGTAVDDADHRISQLAGLDIIHTMPLEITDINNASASPTPGIEYGFLAAAISEWVSNAAPSGAAVLTQPYTSIKFDQLMHADIAADGLLDGEGLDPTGVKIALSFGTTPLSPTVYRQGIGVSLLEIASSGINKTGVTPSNSVSLLTYAEAYAADADKMFDGVPPVGITTPSIAIIAPSSPGWLSGSQNVSARVQDYTGLTSDSLVVDSGGARLLTTNLNTPAWPLDTTKLTDGTHTATVSATNVAGLSSHAELTFQVDNTPPSLAIDSAAYYQNPYAAFSYHCVITGTVSDAESGPAGSVTAVWGDSNGETTGSASLVNNMFTMDLQAPIPLSWSDPNGLTVTVHDAAGNAATYQHTLKVCSDGSTAYYTCTKTCTLN